MGSLLNALRETCQRFGSDRRYWVAYSGGLDSTVLLQLASQLPDYSFSAIHIHHGLNPSADAWVMQCEQTAADFKLPFHLVKLQLNTHGKSIEAEARRLRYEALASFLEDGDVLLTAHHQDDQAETFLVQLCRGAGVKGLSAMPAEKDFGRGVQVRPLLSVSRSTLEAYAQAHGLRWVEDSSNASAQFTRNFIRHTVLPPLAARWPSIQAVIARSASHCAEADVLLSGLLAEKLKTLAGSRVGTLSVAGLNAVAPVLQKAILRVWFDQRGVIQPSAKKLDAILSDVLPAAWDRQCCVAWGAVELRRHRDDLHCVKAVKVGALALTWDLPQPVVLPDGRVLKAVPVQGQGMSQRVERVHLTYRQGGERLNLAGRGRLLIKNLLQEAAVLPWERAGLPFMYVQDTLVGVVGIGIDANYLARPDEAGWVFLLT